MTYYGKLPIVLLSEIASGSEDTYRCRIASYLLGRMGESISAEEIARDCYVSKSAVSRFCREIGLEDFSELKEIQQKADRTFAELAPDADTRGRAGILVRGASGAMEKAAETLDITALGVLVRDICEAERIACFGLLKAETAAINLQSDLTMLGLKALTKVSYRDQTDFLSRSRTDDLVLIFSYRGIYFDYDLPPEIRQGKAKIWVITGNPDARERILRQAGNIRVLAFRSDLDFVSHPYQLMAVSGIIGQETAAFLRRE